MIPDPVNPFDVATPEVCDHQPVARYYGPYGSGLQRHLRSKVVCANCDRVLGI